MSTEIAIIEEIAEEKWPEIYGQGKVNSYYERVKKHVSEEVPDVTTLKGRKAIASLSGKVSSSKTAVEKPGRAYLKKIKELPKTIEEELRDFVILMDKLRDDVRQPLTDYEAEQKELEAKRLAEEAAKALAVQIESDHELALFMHAEYRRQKIEANRLELDRKAAEQLRIEQEYAARATKEAEEKASAAILEAKLDAERAIREKAESEARAAQAILDAQAAAAKAESDAKLAAEQALQKAERDKQLAIEQERQRAAAETQRLANIKAAEDAAAAKAAANKNHQKKINNESLDDLVELGCTDELAKKIITALAKKTLRHLSINY